MNELKLSLVIPCYEKHEYLVELFNSIELSMVGYENVTEVILLDDCSLNEKIFEVCSMYGFVKYFRNKKNLGLFKNWNKSFRIANGEFVSIICQDDVLDVDYISSFFDALQRYPEIELFYTNFVCFNENTNTIKHDMKMPFGYKSKLEVLTFASEFGFGVSGVSNTIRKKVFLESPGFETDSMGSNDWELIYCHLNWAYCYGDKRPLLKYRKHAESASSVNGHICGISTFNIYNNINGKNSAIKFRLFESASWSMHYLGWKKSKDFNNKNVKQFLLFLNENFLFKALHHIPLIHAKRLMKILAIKLYRKFF